MGRIKAGKKSSRANAAKATAARQKLRSPSPSASDKSEIATLPSTSEDFGISDDESLHSMSDHGNNVLQEQPLSEAQALEFHRLREENNWNSFLWEELPDTECLEPQAELEDEEDMEIADESALAVFSQFLSNAQVAARRAEKLKEKETGRKRKRGPYTGKSKQTKLKHRKIGASLKGQGFLGLKEFMQHKQTQKHELGSASEPSTPGVSIPGTPDVTSDESDDPGEPESADEEIIISEPVASSHPSSSDTCSRTEEPDYLNPVNLAHVKLRELLEAFSNDTYLLDNSLESASEKALNQLNYRNFPVLERAAARLELETKNKAHDLVFRSRILAMWGTLSLYLDPTVAYT
ncbi:hypothetical protein C8R44DRAFT_740745 [Mycena epipterygia]|nr:hypothetical protein C8R44DRAFT_740745 [Mycena epipterygia]